MLAQRDVQDVVLCAVRQERSHVFYFSHLFEHGNPVQKLGIILILIPRNRRNSVLWLELVAHRRVINYDDVSHVSPNASQIFHKSIVMVSAVLSEQIFITPLLFFVKDVH